ncbi:MAG: UDP-N-acetylmuramoyl-L-alanine--D-glutamate ligase [Eubacteriales bacterium]
MYKRNNVLIVGVARSGIGAANLLHSLGAKVTINDIKTESDLSDQLQLLDKGVNLTLGCKADGLVAGKDLIVVSPGIPTSLSFFEVAKKRRVPVIGEVELAYSVCPARVAAITGTNGKTTTTALLGAIFKKQSENSFIVGNIGFAFSSKVLEMKEDSNVALEVSSFQMETIKKFRPKVSAILNITEDHIARHGSMDEYIRCKKRIFENQKDGDVLVLNYDDQTTRKMADEAKCKVVFFSKGDIDFDGACVADNKIIIKDDGKIIEICDKENVSLPGVHNLENVLAAVAIAHFYGIGEDAISYAVQNFKSVEHRLEFVLEHTGIRYINDSKGTNTDASVWAVKAMDRPTIIILGGYEKGAEFDGLIESFSELIKGAVVIGQTKEKIIAAMKKAGFKNYKESNTFEDAVYTALEMASEGYNILLSPACASFDMFKDFEQRGRRFKEIAREIQEKDNE